MKIIYNMVVFDLHNDLLTSRLSVKKKRLEFNGFNALSGVVLAVWTTRLKCSARVITSLTAPFRSFKSETEIRFGIEDLGFVEREGLDGLQAAPLSYAGLTWNFDNGLAGGAYGIASLSELGKRTIERMNEAGIAADTAHLNDRSFDCVLDCAARVMDSHCACRARNGHKRNLTDIQMKKISDRKGIIGITAATELEVRTIEDFIANIDHGVETAGIDCIAIGTDFYGSTPPAGLETYSHFYDIENALFKKGYTKNDIDKILFANARNFFKRT